MRQIVIIRCGEHEEMLVTLLNIEKLTLHWKIPFFL